MKRIKYISLPIIFFALISSTSAQEKYYAQKIHPLESPLIGKNSTIIEVSPDVL